MNKLEQLKTMTTVVADTGDIASIRRFQPTDATTNPALLLKAAQTEECRSLLEESVSWAKAQGTSGTEFLQQATERFTIHIGREIAQIVPGRVSTEVDARLSFDTQAMVDKAKQLIDLYAEAGISSDRILIKLASTWEGIRAAEILEKSGIQCNLTLLFCFAQAAACADAGVTLISPFVGRIYDWYQNKNPDQKIPPQDDPGVQSVKRIYQYYKENNYPTIVMGASFRSTGQIEELAGCDNLTVSPDLLEALASDNAPLPRQLSPDSLDGSQSGIVEMDEKAFRWQLNDDPMANEKLAEGIRKFAVDQCQLEALIEEIS
ncbi:MAG: transaldolase [Porticoccaceae bacterium]|nr:transaldolase [Porticoccaceae bacterium]